MPQITFTPEQKRELAALPNLAALPDDRPVVCSFRQLSLMSTLPLGSVGGMLARELHPVIKGTNAYQAGDLRAFCARHTARTVARITLAVASQPAHKLADPSDAVRTYISDLLNQSKE